MYLTADKVVNALVCAQQLLAREEIYSGNHSLLPVSIDTLKDTIESISGYKVEMRSVVFQGTHVFARVEKFADRTATIDVKHSLEEDWKRFVATKELLHLVIDNDEDMSPYGDQTLDKLVRDGHIGIISQNGDKPPAQSELIAEVAAMELLYPIQNRADDHKAVLGGEVTYAKLAIRYGIPINFVDTVFSREYMTKLTHVFEQYKADAPLNGLFGKK